MTLFQLNKKAQEVKAIIDSLYHRFNLPVYVEDDVCRIIAIATSIKEGDEVWLDGEKVRLENLALQVRMVSRKEAMRALKERPVTQEEE